MEAMDNQQKDVLPLPYAGSFGPAPKCLIRFEGFFSGRRHLPPDHPQRTALIIVEIAGKSKTL
jgi:hypothetical protein